MSTTFRIATQSTGTMDLFALQGNIDAQAETLLKELPQKVRQPRVSFDFARTGRINSMGIALLLRCFRHIKEEKKADISLLELNQTTTLLFKMTGIFMLATPVKSQTDAKEA
jgi:ABC-type transporter Mla MlaB component